MTIDRFQRIVLRISNQMFVRHYLWLNYPNDPQLMGLQFTNNPTGDRRGKPISCECGDCRKCKHREYMKKHRPKAQDDTPRLFTELQQLGFTRRDDDIWVIERSEVLA